MYLHRDHFIIIKKFEKTAKLANYLF